MLNSLFISDIKIYRYIHSQNISIYHLFIELYYLYIHIIVSSPHSEIRSHGLGQPGNGLGFSEASSPATKRAATDFGEGEGDEKLVGADMC